jgi:hypothetical protein
MSMKMMIMVIKIYKNRNYLKLVKIRKRRVLVNLV